MALPALLLQRLLLLRRLGMADIGIDDNNIIFLDVEAFILYMKQTASLDHIEEFTERMRMHRAVPVGIVFCLCHIHQAAVDLGKIAAVDFI